MGGKDWDVEESFLYMAARYYDPRFGRFTSRDPEQTTMSPYSYCANNPISLVDPTGHRSGCAGGGYSLNYPRKDYNFLMWARNHPEPQERPKLAPILQIYKNSDYVDASGKPPTAWSEAEAYYHLVIENVDDYMGWLQSEFPEFNYYYTNLNMRAEAYGKAEFLFDYTIDFLMDPNLQGTVGSRGGGFGETENLINGTNPEITVAKNWYGERDVAYIRASIASGIVHEVGEMAAQHFFGFERSKLGVGPADYVAAAWVSEYAERGFFAGAPIKNMNSWWSQYGHQVWSLAHIAYEYKTNPWRNDEEYLIRRGIDNNWWRWGVR